MQKSVKLKEPNIYVIGFPERKERIGQKSYLKR